MHPEELLRNAILARLPEPELERLGKSLEVFDAVLRQQVYQAGRPITQVFFPLSSVFSIVGYAEERVLVEVATIGREGMVGIPLFLGAGSSPHPSFCQVPGPTARLDGADFHAALTGDGALHRLLSRFTQATMVQVAQNVVCNSTHSTVQRACRWLLTTHDRVGRDEFSLTQEFLAQMLGVRRPTVSETAGRLQAQGLIRYSRGEMAITDRDGLQRMACACYAIVRAEFDDLTQEG